MNKSFTYALFFCAALCVPASGVFGAGGSVSVEKEGRPLTDAELAEARSAPSVERGPHDGFLANPLVIEASSAAVYREGDAAPYPFRLFLPKSIRPKKKYPLILWLHGAGESQSDNESQLAHMQPSIDLLAGPNRPDFFLAAVQCPKETGSWGRPDPRAPGGETPLEMLDKITDALTREFPIDTHRISLLGICSGAMAGFDLIEKFPRRFSAFAACSPSQPGPNVDAYRRLPIWMFNNRDDLDVWSDNAPLAKAVNRSGGDLYLTIHTSGGHDTWTGAQRDDHVLEWLLKQRRRRPTFPRFVSAESHSAAKTFFLFWLPIAVFLFCAVRFRRIKNQERNSP